MVAGNRNLRRVKASFSGLAEGILKRRILPPQRQPRISTHSLIPRQTVTGAAATPQEMAADRMVDVEAGIGEVTRDADVERGDNPNATYLRTTWDNQNDAAADESLHAAGDQDVKMDPTQGGVTSNGSPTKYIRGSSRTNTWGYIHDASFDYRSDNPRQYDNLAELVDIEVLRRNPCRGPMYNTYE